MTGLSPEVQERLRALARSRGYPADDPTIARLLSTLAAVLEQGRRVNLTAARTLDDAVVVLAQSALAVVRAWPDSTPPALVVDLGTGNGFPGVAAALAWPSARVLLVERRRKKADAVSHCVTQAGIENAIVVPLDGRQLLRERPQVASAVDLVTVRAVGTLASVVPVVAGWLAPGGRIAHWKGAALSREEMADGKRAARGAGLRVLEPLAFPDAAGPAHLVLYERPRGG